MGNKPLGSAQARQKWSRVPPAAEWDLQPQTGLGHPACSSPGRLEAGEA